MKISIIILLILQFSMLYSQHQEDRNWCILNCEYEDADRERANKIYLKKLKRKGVRDIPLRFPLRFVFVQEDTSRASVPLEKLDIVIENLNKAYTKASISFYVDRVEIIESKIRLEELSRNNFNLYDKFSKEHDLEDKITVYVLEHEKEFCNVKENRVSCSRTGGFSHILSERTNNVVVSKFDLEDLKVVAHEFGHFFGLFHTFEERLFGKDTFNIKLCNSTGDKICDTNPDPGTVFEIYINYSTCEMKGLKDENGNEYKPIIENYMSYYKPCYLKEYSFTEEQITVMKLASRLQMRRKFSR